MRNIDSILDLLLLSLAKKIVLVPISGRKGHGSYPIFSGYSNLAMNLRWADVILKRFLVNTQVQVNKPSFFEKWAFHIQRYYLYASRRLIPFKLNTR